MHFSNPFEKKSNIKIQGNDNQNLNKKDITRENVKKNLIVALDKKNDNLFKFNSEKIALEIEEEIYQLNGNDSKNKSYREKIKKIESRIKGSKNRFIRDALKNGLIDVKSFCQIDDNNFHDDNYFKKLLGENIHEDDNKNRYLNKGNFHSYFPPNLRNMINIKKNNNITVHSNLDNDVNQNEKANNSNKDDKKDITGNINDNNNNDKIKINDEKNIEERNQQKNTEKYNNEDNSENVFENNTDEIQKKEKNIIEEKEKNIKNIKQINNKEKDIFNDNIEIKKAEINKEEDIFNDNVEIKKSDNNKEEDIFNIKTEELNKLDNKKINEK
jgi:hypothetical protein